MITGTMEYEQDRVRLCLHVSQLMQSGESFMRWARDERLLPYEFVIDEEGIRFGPIAHERWIEYLNNKPPESPEEIK